MGFYGENFNDCGKLGEKEDIEVIPKKNL